MRLLPLITYLFIPGSFAIEPYSPGGGLALDHAPDTSFQSELVDSVHNVNEVVGSQESASKNTVVMPQIQANSSDFEKEKLDPLCTKKEHKVQNSGDLNRIVNTCPYISGSIVITKYQEPIIDLGKLSWIGGNFQVSGISSVVRINAPSITTIGGRFHLSELTSLTSIYFPYLKSVDTIEWKILPILSTIGFDAGLDQIKTLLISDTSLVGFSLKEGVRELTTLDLNNNRFLESITSNVKSVTGSLSISANARNVIVSFPQLETVSNLTIRDVTSLDIHNIKEIKGSAKFYENHFQQLKIQKLTKVGGTLSIIENYNLKDGDLPNLTEVDGGLMISNNSNIDRINFFPRLKMIGGGVQLTGDFKDTSFNKLDMVKGSAMIKTSSNSFDCSKWTNTDHLIIRGGNIICDAAGEKEELHYDSNDVQGTLTKSKTGSGVNIRNGGVRNRVSTILGFSALLYVL